MILTKVLFLTLEQLFENRVLLINENCQPIMSTPSPEGAIRVDIAHRAIKSGTLNTLLSLKLIEYKQRKTIRQKTYGYYKLSEMASNLIKTRVPVFEGELVKL